MTCDVFKMSLLLSLFIGILSTNQDRQQPFSFGSKLLTFPQPLGRNHFSLLLWNCCREKKSLFAQHCGCDRLWNGKGQEQIHDAVAFPHPGDSPGQHGRRKLHAVHIRRKHTNYILCFQNTKKEIRELTELPNSPRQCDNPSSTRGVSTQKKLLSFLSVSASSESSASPQKVRAHLSLSFSLIENLAQKY